MHKVIRETDAQMVNYNDKTDTRICFQVLENH